MMTRKITQTQYQNYPVQRDLFVSKSTLEIMYQYFLKYGQEHDNVFPTIYIATSGVICDITTGGKKVNFVDYIESFIESDYPEYLSSGFGLNTIAYHIIYTA